MTVEELIEELKQQPNQRVPIVLRVRESDGDVRISDPRVYFNGPNVVIEED